jgi:hypothetical protein
MQTLAPVRAQHSQRRAWGFYHDSTLPPLVPALWLLSLNLAGLAVMKGIFKAGVWVAVLSLIAVLSIMAYRASSLGRRS